MKICNWISRSYKEMSSSTKKNLMKLTMGLVIFILFLRWINFADNLKYLLQANISYIILAFTIMVISTTLRGVRFHQIAHATQNPIPLKKSILVNYIIAMITLITPARLGEGGKIFFFDNKKQLGACFIFEKIADFGILLIAAIYALFMFKKYTNLVFIIFLIFVVGLLVLFNIERILNFVLRKDVLQEGWLREAFKKVSKENWMYFTGYTFSIWFIGILAQYFLAKSLGLTIPILLLIQVSAVAVIAGTLSGTPQGIGTCQFIYTLLLTENLNLSKEVIGIFMIEMLFVSYLMVVIVFLVGHIFLKYDKNGWRNK